MQLPHQHKKTRLAPTPSGFLHLGNILSFSITAAIAQKNGAGTLLRIDDIDRARVNNQYLADIFDTLNFLELPWGEGPHDAADFEEKHSQLKRISIYNDALGQLAANGLVFACTCSRLQLTDGFVCTCLEKHLPLATPNVAWRLITGDAQSINIKQYNGQPVAVLLPAEMNNFVVRKKDGFPAYQLTSVIDDLFYGVDLVVRGEDLWPSTIAQHVLALALDKDNFNDIAFYHHPLLTAQSGEKLSKSAGATSIKYLRESGKKPREIYTQIAAMLGATAPVDDWQQLADMVLKAGKIEI